MLVHAVHGVLKRACSTKDKDCDPHGVRGPDIAVTVRLRDKRILTAMGHGGRHQHAQRHGLATKFGHISSLANEKNQPPALAAMPTLLPTAASTAEADRAALHTTASGVPNEHVSRLRQ